MTILRRLLLFLLLCALGPAPVPAADIGDPNVPFQLANKSFEDGKFADALALYQMLIESGNGNATVHANAGTAAFRAGDVGRAVAHFERALRLDPTNERAAHNLARIAPETNRLPDDASAFAIARAALARAPGWLFVAAIEVTFVLLLVGLWQWSRRPADSTARGEWAIRAGVAGAALAVAIGVAFLHDAARQRWGDAVLAQKGVSRLGPGEKYFEQLELPPGTLVELPEAPIDGWVRVRLRDGRTGYVESRLLAPL